jgi:D-3-phosphoglycerate dehydrogenase
MPHTIFVTAQRLAPGGMQVLEEARCRVLLMGDGGGAREVERVLAEEPVDAVISRTLPLTEKAILAASSLKVVSKHGVGVNNIDVEACTRRGVPVFVTPGANADSVAELTFALMLAAARRVPWLDSELRAGRWSRAQDGVQLRGRTLGLVGVGAIGSRVARLAQAFGMAVLGFDPALRAKPAPPGVRMVSGLEDLLTRSDVVSLHAPLTAQTRSLIGADELALMPPGAILINTARGELVDETALVEALGSGRLFAAGLDTMRREPLPPDSPLLAAPNVVLSPHVGGSTGAALDATARAAAENVVRFLQHQPVDPARCVNSDTLDSVQREAAP